MKSLNIGSIVIDCRDFDTMMHFWQEALHYTPLYPPEEGWVILKDPSGKGPNVSINRAQEVGRLRNRLHLDLYAEAQKEEVDRLISLGAKLYRTPDEGEDFVVLADPEDNLFCVIDMGRR